MEGVDDWPQGCLFLPPLWTPLAPQGRHARTPIVTCDLRAPTSCPPCQARVALNITLSHRKQTRKKITKIWSLLRLKIFQIKVIVKWFSTGQHIAIGDFLEVDSSIFVGIYRIFRYLTDFKVNESKFHRFANVTQRGANYTAFNFWLFPLSGQGGMITDWHVCVSMGVWGLRRGSGVGQWVVVDMFETSGENLVNVRLSKWQQSSGAVID